MTFWKVSRLKDFLKQSPYDGLSHLIKLQASDSFKRNFFFDVIPKFVRVQ